MYTVGATEKYAVNICGGPSFISETYEYILILLPYSSLLHSVFL